MWTMCSIPVTRCSIFFKKKQGFISSQLHRGIGGRSSVFINYAVWESTEHLKDALSDRVWICPCTLPRRDHGITTPLSQSRRSWNLHRLTNSRLKFSHSISGIIGDRILFCLNHPEHDTTYSCQMHIFFVPMCNVCRQRESYIPVKRMVVK